MTWRTYLISFTVQDCFLFRFVCIELSLIWFLQIWVAIHVYGTMINWFTLIKKLMQTYIVIVSGSIVNVSTVHLNGIWHLIWRYLSKHVLGGHPADTTAFPEGVRLIQVSLYFEITQNLYRAINSWGVRHISVFLGIKDEFPAWRRSCLKFSHKRNINSIKKIEWIA